MIVIATHADAAHAILADADLRERNVLGAFEDTTNEVVLHTDSRLLPRRPAARASWNVLEADHARPGEALPMTYHMNRLQSIPGPVQYAVSLNAGDAIHPDCILSTRSMNHPLHTAPTLEAQVGVSGPPGTASDLVRRGPLGYGFHEDGCRSGFEAADLVEAAALERAA